jgi:hypothetical protein
MSLQDSTLSCIAVVRIQRSLPAPES